MGEGLKPVMLASFGLSFYSDSLNRRFRGADVDFYTLLDYAIVLAC